MRSRGWLPWVLNLLCLETALGSPIYHGLTVQLMSEILPLDRAIWTGQTPRQAFRLRAFV